MATKNYNYIEIHKFAEKINDNYQLTVDSKALTPMQKYEYDLLIYFQEEWDSIHKIEKVNGYFRNDNLTDIALLKFYDICTKEISNKKFDFVSFKFGYHVLNKFVQFYNARYQKPTNQYTYPPSPIIPSKINLSIDKDWVKNGKVMNKIHKQVLADWQNCDKYSINETIAWLAYSVIFYNGVNDKKTLLAMMDSLLNQPMHDFINELTFVQINYHSPKYGNSLKNDVLQVNQQIVLHPVVQMWLLAYKKHEKSTVKIDIEKKLITQLNRLMSEPLLKQLSLSYLLKYASYVWEMNTEIDQTMVSILQGQYRTLGLESEHFNALLHDKFQVDTQVKYEISELVTFSITANTDKQKNTHALTNNEEIQDLLAHIKTCLKYKVATADIKQYTDTTLPRKEAESQVYIYKLQNPKQKFHKQNQQYFLSWVISLVELSHRKSNASTDSILKYVGIIGEIWLAHTNNQALLDWSSEDFDEMYAEILDSIQAKDLSYPAKLFQRLHNFLVHEYDIALTDVPYRDNKTRVRSQWYSPQFYQSLKAQIRQSIEPIESPMFELLYILLYRLGLRKKELLGLMYSDIENIDSECPSLIIRANRYRKLKTDGSRRRVPLFALLKPDELADFQKFIAINKPKNKSSFIFSLSTENQPIADHVPLKLLKIIGKDIGYDSFNTLTLHGFRHTAYTNLSLLCHADSVLYQMMTDYNIDNEMRIKQALLGNNSYHQAMWYAIAFLFGHASPSRGLEHYLHAGFLMATYQISQEDVSIDFGTFNNITGISKKRLGENGHEKVINTVQLQKIRKILFKEMLDRKQRKSSIVNIIQAIEDKDDNALSDNVFKKYNLNKIIGFLHRMSEQTDFNDAIREYLISEEDADMFLSRAYQIQKIKTIRNAHRFFSNSEIASNQLSPSPLIFDSEKRKLGLMLDKASEPSITNFDNWFYFISTAKQKINRNEAYIEFPVDSRDDVVGFLKVGCQLLDAQYWLVHALDVIIKNLKTDIKIENCNYDNRPSVIRVGISHENSGQYHFSALLRYFVHVSLIVDWRIMV